jgi:hypothetical protein
MKKGAKGKAKAKAKKPPLGTPAIRDLELMDPGAKRVKGGRRLGKRMGP